MENKIKNSEKYLNSILEEKNGFSIPKNYFSTVEEDVEVKLCEEIFTKEKGFKIPDAYFNNLENDILAKVSIAEKETKVISLKQRAYKFISIVAAASVILFIGLNSFIFNIEEELSLDSLSDNDIEYWLDSSILNTNDVAAILEYDILKEADFIFTTLEDKNIEDYINNSLILSE